MPTHALADSSDVALHEFLDFLRFASISSDPAYANDMHMCVQWLKSRLEALPLKVEIWNNAEGHPVVFASYMEAGPGQPTILLYNHYDVQPVEPLEAWQSPPFTPEVRHGEVYARGAQDNKGQCFFVLQALRKLFKEQGKLPINIKWIIEGEEEIGSRHLPALLQSKHDQLAADYLLIVDVGIAGLDIPSVTLGVRGIVTMEITLRGSSGDLHSGIHGGIVYNPLHALVELLASLRDSTGRITVPHFYDAVETPPSSLLSDCIAQFSSERYARDFAAATTGGEQEFPPLVRAWLRPTIEINGVTGGYSGNGFKTVIPAVASAKFSARLVPHQDPQTVAESIRVFLLARVPKGMDASITIFPGMGEAVRADPASPLVKAFIASYEQVFSRPCSCCLDGGSIPITAVLQRVSQADVLLVGLGLPTDHIHAPNEHFGVERLSQGALMIAQGLINLRRQ